MVIFVGKEQIRIQEIDEEKDDMRIGVYDERIPNSSKLIKTFKAGVKGCDLAVKYAEDLIIEWGGKKPTKCTHCNEMNSWIEQLMPIIKEYKDGDDEALDGDSVDNLCRIIKVKINLQEGNITNDEYEKLIDKVVK